MNTERAARLRSEGYSWAQVAKKMNTTVFKLRKAWALAGLPPDHSYQMRRRRNRVTPEKIARARALREQGIRWKVIARQVGMHISNLHLHVYTPREAPSAQVLEAVRLRALGNRWKEIGRLVGVDANYLAHQIRKYKTAGVL